MRVDDCVGLPVKVRPLKGSGFVTAILVALDGDVATIRPTGHRSTVDVPRDRVIVWKSGVAQWRRRNGSAKTT